MWYLAASMSALIFVWISSIGYTSAVISTTITNTCDRHIKDVIWEKTDPPVVVRQRINSTFPEKLEVTFENVQEELEVTLLAHPFIDNEADCPADKPNTSLPYIDKYIYGHTLNQTKSGYQSYSCDRIFTGCYYIQLTNKEDKNWVKGPIFYNTTTRYNDTKMNCFNSGFSPEDSESKKTHYATLSVPLKCFTVKVSIWELIGHVTDSTREEIENGTILKTQTCRFSIKEPPTCDRENAAPRLIVRNPRIESTSDSERWRVEIEWINLKGGGASYYSKYNLIMADCAKNYKAEDLFLWSNVHSYGVISHGFQNPVNTAPADVSVLTVNVLWITGYVALCIITVLILYFIWQFGAIKRAMEWTRHITPQKPDVTIKLDNGKESRQILLMYAKSSPDFMNKMNAYRDEIQRKCQCRVYDLQSEEDANAIADMGPIRWTEHILRDGSKVIWVDTPQLRSLLKTSNNKTEEEKEEYARDFRNPALLFALDHIISIARNVITQYQRYFVVQCKEFKVDNDNDDDDPLLAVSPQARYPIPERFEDLCKDICDSMPPLK